VKFDVLYNISVLPKISKPRPPSIFNLAPKSSLLERCPLKAPALVKPTKLGLSSPSTGFILNRVAKWFSTSCAVASSMI